ncbi:MAG: N-acetylornithine carbamoyltransferase [Myxococcota bacterium]|jgi:N-acetylornithine carbamoyltransferase
MPSHFIDGTEPGPFGVSDIALRALELRAGSAPVRRPGARLAAMFLNPSLRTRTSLEAACSVLGVHPIILEPGRTSWALELREGAVMNGDAAEHVCDAVRVLSSYVDILAVRAFAGLVDRDVDRADPVIKAFTDYSPVPVVNLESARFHPLQGLADTATWMSRLGPDLQGQPITLTWAPHPKALPLAVPHQVLMSSALQGMDVTVAHPEGMDLDPAIVARAENLADGAGGSVRITHDQDEGLRGARVVVAKSWSGFSGYGRREEEAERRASHADWRITNRKLDLTDNGGFMHCLPVRRNIVVDDAVMDSHRSWVYEEAGLRLWTATALLEGMLSEVPWNGR